MAVQVSSGGLIRVVIWEASIIQMHAPGGMVDRWTRKAAEETAALAKAVAPKRSGDLARSIRVWSETRTSRKVVGYYVRANVRTRPSPHWKHATPYALYVHEGTQGPITANKRYPWLVKRSPTTGFPVPGPKRWGRGYLLVPLDKMRMRQSDIPRSLRTRRTEVRGQRPQPFLATPLRYVMRKVAH